MAEAGAALLIDFGSTYTKVRAVDVLGARLLGTGQGPSTVRTDVAIGMRAALADLERRLGALPTFRYRLASSSAAGGLRMVTIGLVRELTAEAARQAALGAGAKLVGAFAYRLTRSDVATIVGLEPDIVLLAGGTDGGNSEVVLHNARALAASALAAPIVYAGNRAAADDALDVLAHKTVALADNVMPEFNVLAPDSAREAIRRIFIERIVSAKGIDRARAMFDNVLMPTPAAVMDGAKLLADGTGGEPGFGDLLVVDPGGATTDVHSVCDGIARGSSVVAKGLPEQRVKRTVEGDLGMRHSASSVLEAVGSEALAADAALAPAEIEVLLARIAADPERVPADAVERRFDRALLRAAVRTAVKRHAGTVETVYTALGPVDVQYGKDLRGVETVIATGGAPVHVGDVGALLDAVRYDPEQPQSLRPRAPRLLLDRDYVLFACGLLASVNAPAALALGRASLAPAAPHDVEQEISVAL